MPALSTLGSASVKAYGGTSAVDSGFNFTFTAGGGVGRNGPSLLAIIM